MFFDLAAAEADCELLTFQFSDNLRHPLTPEAHHIGSHMQSVRARRLVGTTAS